jgi:hypothetical protein
MAFATLTTARLFHGLTAAAEKPIYKWAFYQSCEPFGLWSRTDSTQSGTFGSSVKTVVFNRASGRRPILAYLSFSLFTYGDYPDFKDDPYQKKIKKIK